VIYKEWVQSTVGDIKAFIIWDISLLGIVI
jgi:hypothetical protein